MGSKAWRRSHAGDLCDGSRWRKMPDESGGPQYIENVARNCGSGKWCRVQRPGAAQHFFGRHFLANFEALGGAGKPGKLVQDPLVQMPIGFRPTGRIPNNHRVQRNRATAGRRAWPRQPAKSCTAGCRGKPAEPNRPARGAGFRAPANGVRMTACCLTEANRLFLMPPPRTQGHSAPQPCTANAACLATPLGLI